MIDFLRENMAPVMFGGLVVFLVIGYPAAFSLAAVGLFFGLVAMQLGLIAPEFLGNLTYQLYGVLSNDLLLAIRDQEKVTWSGETRAPINGRGVYPRALQDPLPLWIAVGGTPQSVARAGVYGLPLALAIIGGEPARFAPLFDLYRQAAEKGGHDPAKLKTSINVHGFIADTTQAAVDQFHGPSTEVMNRIGRERGWGPSSRAQYDRSTGPDGALFIGDPETVARKIIAHHKVFRNDRFLLQMAIGLMPHDQIMRGIELYGTKVAPIVRDALGSK